MKPSELYKVLDSLARLYERSGASDEAEALRSFRGAVATSRPQNLNDLIKKLESIQRVDGDNGSARNENSDSLK
jgi:hypothetical protein